MAIDDHSITKCEDFAKTQLASRFDSKTSNNELKIFFGAFYWNTPNAFTFHDGDRTLIKELVKHLKEIKDTDGNFKRFELDQMKRESKRKVLSGTVITSIGLFFSAQNKLCTNINSFKKVTAEVKIEELFSKTKKILQSDLHKKMLASFKKDMIKFDANEFPPLCSISCVYCKEPKKLHFSKTYFVMSNFSKHLDWCLKNNQNNSASHETKNKQKSTHVAEADPKLVEIEISALNDNEKFIYFQINHQVNRIRKIAVENKERKSIYNIQINKTEHFKIDTALIAADGDCLVGAMAHQLYGHKLQSENHKKATKILRQDAVNYMKNNIDDFKNVIAYADDFAKFSKEKDDDAAIGDYIENLSKPTIWCGTEMLIAISRLKSINIIIFCENGTSCMVQPFNFDFNSCAILLFCRYETILKSNTENNHYNSVIRMDENAMYASTNKIISGLSPAKIVLE